METNNYPPRIGNVSKIRLLGDSHHNTRIAFVEFERAESAKAALNCSGALLGMWIRARAGVSVRMLSNINPRSSLQVHYPFGCHHPRLLYAQNPVTMNSSDPLLGNPSP